MTLRALPGQLFAHQLTPDNAAALLAWLLATPLPPRAHALLTGDGRLLLRGPKGDDVVLVDEWVVRTPGGHLMVCSSALCDVLESAGVPQQKAA